MFVAFSEISTRKRYENQFLAALDAEELKN
jgi:hypothetical protein